MKLSKRRRSGYAVLNNEDHSPPHTEKPPPLAPAEKHKPSSPYLYKSTGPTTSTPTTPSTSKKLANGAVRTREVATITPAPTDVEEVMKEWTKALEQHNEICKIKVELEREKKKIGWWRWKYWRWIDRKQGTRLAEERLWGRLERRREGCEF